MSAISAELIAAYRAATYRVDSPALTINLAIDEYSKELESLLSHYQVASFAFITAYNPYSEPTTPEANRAAQEALHLPPLGQSLKRRPIERSRMFQFILRADIAQQAIAPYWPHQLKANRHAVS